MKLAEFPVLADEGIAPAVVEGLCSEGVDVLDVKEQRLHGTSDMDLIRLATEQGRVVLTHDRDFGRLAIVVLEPMIGIIYPRPGHIDPEFTLASLRALYRIGMDVTSPFIIVVERREDDVRIRVRSY